MLSPSSISIYCVNAQCNVSFQKVHSFDAELHLVMHSECSFWLNPNRVSLEWSESVQISLLSCSGEEWCVIRRTMCPVCQRAFCSRRIHFWWVMLNHCRAHVNVTLTQTISTLDGQVYQWKPENWGKCNDPNLRISDAQGWIHCSAIYATIRETCQCACGATVVA